MIYYNFKMALRGYARNRIFTFLNLTSLVTGLFIAYVAFSYISFELSYDGFHKNSDNIYRVIRTYRSQDYSVIGFPGSESDIKADDQLRQAKVFQSAAGVKDAAQFVVAPNPEFVTVGDKRIETKNILTTNTPASFAAIFSWQLKQGRFETFSEGTKKALLTVSMAQKLFGNEAANNDFAIGKTIKILENDYVIAAIIEDVPTNAHFDFTIAVSNPKIAYWGSHLYVEVNDKSNIKNVEKQMNDAFAVFNPRVAGDVLYKNHSLEPITDIHFETDVLYELKPSGNSMYITMIGFFAFFTILITLFNYANLLLALKSKQNKSIGVRKVIGAKNAAITSQFILEGVLLALIAVPFVALLVKILLPFFNNLMGTEVQINVFADPKSLFLLLLLAIIIGILASLFPAFYIGNKHVMALFKKDLQNKRFQNFPIRRYLVVSQFVILISITSISYFIINQVNFAENKDVGFRKEGIVYAYTSEAQQNIFQEKLRQIPEVETVGNGSDFGINPYNQLTYKIEGIDVVFDDANQLYLDYKGLKAYNLKTTVLPESQNSVVTLINRTAAERFAKLRGISTDKIIGTTVVTEPGYTDLRTGQTGFPFVIGGIFEDINLFSLHTKVEPYFISLSERVRLNGRSIVRFNPKNTASVLKKINAAYSELNATVPLEIEFLDDNIAKLYEQDRRTAYLLWSFNIIAIFLASLGITGVTIFLTVARTKEIGIRKVLGASPFYIIQLLVKEYVFITAIACLISFPIAIYFTNEWLKNFAYRIDVQYFIVGFVGVLTFIATVLIVGFLTYKAAVANPVKSLRTE